MHLSAVYTGLGRGATRWPPPSRPWHSAAKRKSSASRHTTHASDAQAAIGNRDAALRDLSLTLRGIEELRAQLVPSDFFKQDFSTSYKRAYGSAIARQFDAGLEREALETAELARSRAFLDLLASRSIAPAPRRPRVTLPLTLRGSGASSGVASPVTMAPANAADLIRTAARLRSSVAALLGERPRNDHLGGHARWTRPRASSRGHTHAAGGARPRHRAIRGQERQRTRPAAPAVLRESSAAWRTLYTLLIAPVKSVLPSEQRRAADGRAARRAREPELCRAAGREAGATCSRTTRCTTRRRARSSSSPPASAGRTRARVRC